MSNSLFTGFSSLNMQRHIWLEVRPLTKDDVIFGDWKFSNEAKSDEDMKYKHEAWAYCTMTVKPEVFAPLPEMPENFLETFFHRFKNREGCVCTCRITETVKYVGVRKPDQWKHFNEALDLVKEIQYISGENVRQKTLDNLNLQIDEWIKWQQEAFTLTATQFYPKVDAYDIAELDKMSGNETVNAEIVVLQEKIKERKRKRDANRETTLKKYWDEKFPENLPASVVLAVREKILKDGIVQHRGLLGDSW